MKLEEEKFNSLNDIGKKIVNMYRCAKQFKNAIYIEEIISTRIRILPFIVNKSFSCEVYLKCLIELNVSKSSMKHNLLELYNEANIEKCMEQYFNNKEELIKEIKGVSDSFIKWRYIYEKMGESVHHTFLNKFCDCLDRIVRNKIIEEYNIDMDTWFY